MTDGQFCTIANYYHNHDAAKHFEAIRSWRLRQYGQLRRRAKCKETFFFSLSFSFSLTTVINPTINGLFEYLN